MLCIPSSRPSQVGLEGQDRLLRQRRVASVAHRRMTKEIVPETGSESISDRHLHTPGLGVRETVSLLGCR
jgi:hypothetical protein